MVKEGGLETDELALRKASKIIELLDMKLRGLQSEDGRDKIELSTYAKISNWARSSAPWIMAENPH